VLGASSLIYAEATRSQDLPSWIGAHVRMLDYFQGSPAIWVHDYVARHIIVVMCPRLICGGARRNGRSAPVDRGEPDT
jgi:transposase